MPPIFSPIIEKTLLLPFQGDAGKVRVTYHAAKCAEWDATSHLVLAPFREAGLALTTELETNVTAWNAAKAALPRPLTVAGLEAVNAAHQPAQDALRPRLDAHARAVHLATIAELVLRVDWPFAPPQPVPTDPATWDALPDLALTWIAENGVRRVAESWADPN